MINLAANLTMMFPEYDFFDRFHAARGAGFKAVEFLFPYEWSADHLRDALAQNMLTQVLFNMPPGNWQKGERGLACLPGRQSEFQDSVGIALNYAKILQVPRLHCMAGVAPAHANRNELRAVFLDNLKFAADECASAGVKLMIEPINPFDVPDYFLNTSSQALSIIEELNEPCVELQYDLYHMHRMGDDMPAVISKNIDHIGHFQVAGHPGRHEPDNGEVPFYSAFKTIDATSYNGWIGCEYIPANGTKAGLEWARPWLAS